MYPRWSGLTPSRWFWCRAGAYRTTMGGLPGVVQQACERSLEPEAAELAGFVNNCGRGWRPESVLLQDNQSWHGSSRHGLAGANVPTYTARAPDGTSLRLGLTNPQRL